MANKKVTLYGLTATVDVGQALNRNFLNKKNITRNSDEAGGSLQLHTALVEVKKKLSQNSSVQTSKAYTQNFTLLAANGKKVFTSRHDSVTQIQNFATGTVTVKECLDCKIYGNSGVTLTKASGADDDDIKGIVLYVRTADTTSSLHLTADGLLQVFMCEDKFAKFSMEGHLVPKQGYDLNLIEFSLGGTENALEASFTGHGPVDCKISGDIILSPADPKVVAIKAIDTVMAASFPSIPNFSLIDLAGYNVYESTPILADWMTNSLGLGPAAGGQAPNLGIGVGAQHYAVGSEETMYNNCWTACGAGVAIAYDGGLNYAQLFLDGNGF